MTTRPPRDDDLAERVDELEEALTDLRRELRTGRPDRFRPRPPTPRELLRVTHEFTIPAAVAFLESQIRALELLGETLRVLDRTAPADEEVRSRAASAGRETLTRLDDALRRLREELEDGALPRDPEARDIVEDARRLTEEIETRLARAESEAGPSERATDREPGTTIDVESELETIRDQVDRYDDDREGVGDERDGGDDERR